MEQTYLPLEKKEKKKKKKGKAINNISTERFTLGKGLFSTSVCSPEKYLHVPTSVHVHSQVAPQEQPQG